MGMHKLLQKQVLAIESGVKVPRPQGQMAGINSDHGAALSPNMELDGVAGAVLWETKFGKPGDLVAAQERACAILDDHVGPHGTLMKQEQCAGDPHFGMYLYGWSTLRRCARATSHAGLVDRLGRFMRGLRKVYAPCVGQNFRDQRPLIVIPGGRCEQAAPPMSQSADMWWRLIEHMEMPRWWSPKEAARDEFHGVRLLADLLRSGDDLGGPPSDGEHPKLLAPLNVLRSGSRVLAWLDTPPYAMDNMGKDIADGHQVKVGPWVEPCDWTLTDVGAGQVLDYGKFWSKPRPRLPAGQVVRLGVAA